MQIDLDIPEAAEQPEPAAPPLPRYLCGHLVEVRRRAASKPYHGRKRLTCDREELLRVVDREIDFDAIAYAFCELRWYVVFRDLLNLQREGVLVALPDDRWAPAKEVP